jgi:hypothetical protein
MATRRKPRLPDYIVRHEKLVAAEIPTLPNGVGDLWRECQSALAKHEAGDLNWPDDPAYARYRAAARAIRDDRPLIRPSWGRSCDGWLLTVESMRTTSRRSCTPPASSGRWRGRRHDRRRACGQPVDAHGAGGAGLAACPAG